MREPGQETADEPFNVWPENWRTVQLFMSVRNYWFYNPEGGMMGLDWCQVYAILKLKNVRRAAREVERLELMQNAVIDEMAGWS